MTDEKASAEVPDSERIPWQRLQRGKYTFDEICRAYCENFEFVPPYVPEFWMRSMDRQP